MTERQVHDCSGFVWPPDWKFTVTIASDLVVCDVLPMHDFELLRKCCLRLSNHPALDNAFEPGHLEPNYVERWTYEGWWRPGVDERLCRLALQNVMHHYWPERFTYTQHDQLDGLVGFL